MFSTAIFWLIGSKCYGALTFMTVIGFMMVTKDNYWIKSDVSAVNREKTSRLEWFFTDVSLFGVALMFMGQMGGHFF